MAYNSRLDYFIVKKSAKQLWTGYRWSKLAFIFCGFAGFVASSFFVVKYFLGGDSPAHWDLVDYLNGGLGLLITLAFTAFQMLLYSNGFKPEKSASAAGIGTLIAVLIAFSFGMFSEIAQTMEREDATVKARSVESPVFKQALENMRIATVNAGNASPSQTAHAKAQEEVARWEIELTNKQRDHASSKFALKTIQSELAAARAKMQTHGRMAEIEGENRGKVVAQATDTAKGLEYDEDKHYALIRFIQEFFGVKALTAALLFAVVVIGTFEYAFHWIGHIYADYREALERRGYDINPKGKAPEEVKDGDASPDLAFKRSQEQLQREKARMMLEAQRKAAAAEMASYSRDLANQYPTANLRTGTGSTLVSDFRSLAGGLVNGLSGSTEKAQSGLAGKPDQVSGSGSASSVTDVQSFGEGLPESNLAGKPDKVSKPARSVSPDVGQGDTDKVHPLSAEQYAELKSLIREGKVSPTTPKLLALAKVWKETRGWDIASGNMKRRAVFEMALAKMAGEGNPVVVINPQYNPSNGTGGVSKYILNPNL